MSSSSQYHATLERHSCKRSRIYKQSEGLMIRVCRQDMHVLGVTCTSPAGIMGNGECMANVPFAPFRVTEYFSNNTKPRKTLVCVLPSPIFVWTRELKKVKLVRKVDGISLHTGAAYSFSYTLAKFRQRWKKGSLPTTSRTSFLCLI